MLKKIDIGASKIEYIETLNSIIDAVNEIMTWRFETDDESPAENVQPDTVTRPENVQDKFAEQRKWIGKLCKFWDIDNDNLYYGPLTKIHDTSPYCYECNHRICYANCEPVKDDVIYKGGDNE